MGARVMAVSWSSVGRRFYSPRPACGERSDRIGDAIRVRGTLRELRCQRFRGDTPSSRPSPRTRGEGEDYPRPTNGIFLATTLINTTFPSPRRPPTHPPAPPPASPPLRPSRPLPPPPPITPRPPPIR